MKSDQLNLHADPGFDIDVNMGLDLSVFDLLSDSTERSSMLSPYSVASTQSSLLPAEEVELELPQPLTISPGDQFLDFNFDADSASSLLPRPEGYIVPLSSSSIITEGPAIDENPAFEIGDDGGLIDMLYSGLDTQDDGFTNMADLIITQPDVEHVAPDGPEPGAIYQV